MNSNEKNKKDYYSSLKGIHRAVPIIFYALAIFVAICFITANTGAVGSVISSVLCGLFSAGAYGIPALLVIHGIFYGEDLEKKRILSRAIFGIIAVLLISSIEYTVVFWGQDFIFDPIGFYKEQTAGGFVGSTVAFVLVKMLGSFGVYILTAALLAIYITFFFSEKDSALSKVMYTVLGFIATLLALIEKGVKKLFGKWRAARENKKKKENMKKSRQLLDDQFFEVDNGISELKISRLGILEEKTAPPPPAPKPEPKIEVQVEPEPVIMKEPEDKPERTREKKTLNLDYGLEHGMFDAILNDSKELPKEEEPPKKDEPTSSAGYGLDENADSVFTQDFDPFDFAINQKIASKPSSKAVKADIKGIGEINRPLSAMTNEEIDTERKRSDFERKKKMIIEKRAKMTGNTPPSEVSEEEPSDSPAQAVQKTVEFNVSNEPKVVDRKPSEGSSFKGTFEKQEYREHDAERAAAHVAEIVAMNNPAYAKSSNEVYAYVKITETPQKIEEDPLSQEPESLPKEDAPELSGTSPYYAEEVNEPEFLTEPSVEPANEPMPEPTVEVMPELELEEEFKYAPQPVYTPEITNEPDTVPEYNYTPVVNEDTDDYSAEPEYTYEHLSKEVYTEESSAYTTTLEETVTEEPTESPSEDNYYSEEEKNEEPIFKPYTPPSYAETSAAEPAKEEDTLKLERTMLSPTPSASAERDKRYTLLSDEMDVMVEKNEEDEEDDSDYSFSFTDEASKEDTAEAEMTEQRCSENAEEGTYFSFDGDEPAEEEEDEEENFFEQMPEEEAITSEEIPPELQNPEVLRQRAMFPFLDREEESSDEEDEPFAEEITDTYEQEPDEEFTEAQIEEEDDEPPFETDPSPAPKAAIPSNALVPAAEAKKEKEEKPKPDYSNYVFPSIEMLGKDEKKTDENVDEEIQENADKLIETLASFNVTASIKGVDRGPRITRYEVVPAKGVKVSSVMNLQDDIALGLAAEGIRMEAPIPGKSAIGVEIPNVKEETVRLRELLETEDFQNAKSKTTICIGKDVTGQPVINDIAKMPHLLIAGATGMGKSVCINSLIISMLYKSRPDEVKFIMIDPKQVEFTMYNGIPHLLVPVVSDAKQAAGSLMWAVEEMERRYNLLNTQYVRNVDAYNEKVKEDPSIGEPLSRIVIVIDEFADLMLQVRDPVENLVMRIAQKARAAGIHLIIGTQRPAVNVITGTIKANIPSRISCKVASNTDSRTVLDAGGAEKLLNKGDMLFSFAGAIKPLRVQGAFVKDSEVESIMKYLKQFSNGENYDKSVMEEIERAAQKCSKKGSGDERDDDDDDTSGEGYLNDRQFLDAVELAVNSGRIATSLIQRKLSIGYGKAAKFIDIMEDMGIVGEANGPKPREVLINADEWREKLARSMID